MKVAVSIPDDVFTEAETAAGELRLSRSGIYSRALREFLQRRRDEQVTARMNAVMDEFGPECDELDRVRHRAFETYRRIEW